MSKSSLECSTRAHWVVKNSLIRLSYYHLFHFTLSRFVSLCCHSLSCHIPVHFPLFSVRSSCVFTSFGYKHCVSDYQACLRPTLLYLDSGLPAYPLLELFACLPALLEINCLPYLTMCLCLPHICTVTLSDWLPGLSWINELMNEWMNEWFISHTFKRHVYI